MLKITLLQPADQAEKTTRLMLEGRLDGTYVSELDQVWKTLRECGLALEVDLNGISYASESGAAVLRSMREQGVAMLGNSPLTRIWIEDQLADEVSRISLRETKN